MDLYAWVAKHPKDGWTQISGYIPAYESTCVLTDRRLDKVKSELYRSIAMAHAARSGQEVRLVQFREEEVIETWVALAPEGDESNHFVRPADLYDEGMTGGG
jgi:hypothetical protein